MPSNVLIRTYLPEDQPAIDSIQLESQADLKASTPGGYFDDLKNIPTAFNGGAFLVATRDGAVAGFGGLLPDGEIVRMRVASAHRRCGLATKLLAALLAKANELNMPHVHLHTLQEQLCAQALYMSFGFKEVERGVLQGNPVVAYEFVLDSLGGDDE